MSKPTVPEVSLIFDDKLSTLKNETQPKSYKEWKQQQQKQHKPKDTATKEIQNQIQSSADRKKIVTFDLPIEAHPDQKLLPQPIGSSTPMGICQQLDLSLYETKKPDNNGRHSIPANYMMGMQCNQQDYIGFVQQQNDIRMQMQASAPPPAAAAATIRTQTPPTNNYINDDIHQRISTQSNAHQMNFNQNSVQPSKEITLNEIYRLLQNMQVNSQTTPSINSKPDDSPRLNNSPNHGLVNSSPHHHHSPMSMPIVATRFDGPMTHSPYSVNGEPTMRDMLNVILRQQEQLMNIQNQVHMLLMRTATTPQTNQLDSKAHYSNRNADTNANHAEIEEKTKQVGVMTSLEINVQNYNANAIRANDSFNTPPSKAVMATKQSVKQCGCVCNCDARKNSPSTDSGSNDDNFDNSANPGESQTGWTFYGNIMDQVNDVLQNTSPVTNSQPMNKFDGTIATNIENRYSSTNDHIPATKRHVRTAQFKQVGFQIDDVNISGMSKRYIHIEPIYSSNYGILSSEIKLI